MPCIPGYSVGQKIQESSHSEVYRAKQLASGLDVIAKVPFEGLTNRSHIEKMHREFELGSQLDHPHVIRYLDLVPSPSGPVLILEDFGAQQLTSILPGRGIALHRFFAIALQLTDGLGEIHRLNIIHKDIKPGNMLIQPETDLVKLIDFSISIQLDDASHGSVYPTQLEGTLPYLSPEQTGRMNRTMDYRTDFYSLGISFYELLTGSVPFKADDPLDLVHGHLAREPVPPKDVRPEIPGNLSAIVLKLLAKNAEDRYQSALGLKRDLERCAENLDGDDEVLFALGKCDISDKFLIPEKIVGREEEVAQLEISFERVAAGARELLPISGGMGLGKSSLVGEIRKPLTGRHGYLIEGKFEGLGGDEGFGGITSAFRSLMIQILAKNAQEIAHWRGVFETALGANAGVIAAIIPELTQLIGTVKPIPELEVHETRNRFLLVFRTFVAACASEQHPLVLFLDDLNQIDEDSLYLLELLLTDRRIRYFLMICAYRQEKLDSQFALHKFFAEMDKKKIVQQHIELKPLNDEHLLGLVEKTLHSDPEAVRPLAEIIGGKTAGNPFFVKELLKKLYREKCLFFLRDEGYWSWDLAQVGAAEISQNVVSFLIERLKRLQPQSKVVLRHAACFGTTFFARNLADLCEYRLDELGTLLRESLVQEIIEPADGPALATGTHVACYRFCHDQVQQAAYALNTEEELARLHLRIGRMLGAGLDQQDRVTPLIELVGHYNKGAHLIIDSQEREKLAQFNLTAATKAIAAGVYERADQILALGVVNLDQASWVQNHDLAFRLYWAYAETAFLCGKPERAEELRQELEKKARDQDQRARLLGLLMSWQEINGEVEKAVFTGLTALRLMGIRLDENPNPFRLFQARLSVRFRRGLRSPQDLASAGPISSPKVLICLDLLNKLGPVALITGRRALYLLTALKRVNLAIQHGNSPETVFVYLSYASYLGFSLGNWRVGLRFGKAAMTLVDRFPSPVDKSRATFAYGFFIQPWNESWGNLDGYFKVAVEAGRQSGNVLFTSMACALVGFWNPGLDLPMSIRSSRKYRGILEETLMLDQICLADLLLHYRLNLLDRTRSRDVLDTNTFDAAACLRMMEERGFQRGIGVYHLLMAMLCFIFHQLARAAEHIAQAERRLVALFSSPFVAEIVFFKFLINAALYPTLTEDKPSVFRGLKQARQRMKCWADHCSTNFRHRLHLMDAELARIVGNKKAAILNYLEAIEGSNNKLRDAALANWATALFYQEQGCETTSSIYLHETRRCYERWGAGAAVRFMEETLPQQLPTPRLVLPDDLAMERPQPNKHATHSTTTTSPTGELGLAQALDLNAAIKASHIISSEIQYARLLEKLMDVINANAGAQCGTLVLPRGVQLHVAVLKNADGAEVFDTFPLEDCHKVSGAIIRHVFRSGETVVLGDATREGRFTDCQHVRETFCKSVLCTPIRNQDQVTGVLYLENNLATNVFTLGRVELLHLLVSQAAISLENARLFSERHETEQRILQLNERLENLNEDLEVRVCERTFELEQAQRSLLEKAHRAGMAEIATNVLHNVGNLLNSVMTSSNIIQSTINQSKLRGLLKANQLLGPQMDRLPEFLSNDPRAVKLINYYFELGNQYIVEREGLEENMGRLSANINMIREVIAEQQGFASGVVRTETYRLEEIVEEVLGILARTLERSNVRVEKIYGENRPTLLQKSKLMHVIVNLIKNGIEAMEHLAAENRLITICLESREETLYLTVGDQGIGIPEEIREKIFGHGFTTKKSGSGFGLHSCANAMTEMGGTISVQSEGEGKGATFTLRLPYDWDGNDK